MIVLYVFILFQLNQAILGWGQSIRHYVHIINPRKFNWTNLPMSTSMSMSVSVSVSMDMDRDMDVDVDMGRWTRTGTWTWMWTWADPRRFIARDVLLGDVLLQGDVLLRRRFVKEMFCMCVVYVCSGK